MMSRLLMTLCCVLPVIMGTTTADKNAEVSSKTLDRFDELLTLVQKLKSEAGNVSEHKENVHGGRSVDLKMTPTAGFKNNKEYKPSGFHVKIQSSSDVRGHSDEQESAYLYPQGLGPLLFDNCFAENYTKSDPCFMKRRLVPSGRLCHDSLSTANVVGVGFSGRGLYNSEERKSSLIQHECGLGKMFMGRQLPDVVNALGVFQTRVSTKVFTSVDEYTKYLGDKAGERKTRNMFHKEAERLKKRLAQGSSFYTHGKTPVFAVLTVDVLLYDLSLDNVKLIDVNFLLLKDLIALPDVIYSHSSSGAYQEFLHKWGTHYIHTAKVGGQLRIRKIGMVDAGMKAEDVSEAVESDFQDMFSHIQGEKNDKSRKSHSLFSETEMFAEGGSPEIANSLVDFYSPYFRETFSKWLKSIPSHPKAIDFKLHSIDRLFEWNINEIFAGMNSSSSYCISNVHKKLNSTKTACHFKNISDFKVSMSRKMTTLRKAINIYMLEGYHSTTHFHVKGGSPGCEIEDVDTYERNHPGVPWLELKTHKFRLVFDVKHKIIGVAEANEQFIMSYHHGNWFTLQPGQDLTHMYQGCSAGSPGITVRQRICLNNFFMTYNSSTGEFFLTEDDFKESKKTYPYLTKAIVLSGPVAKLLPLSLSKVVNSDGPGKHPFAVPCSIKWQNGLRLEPDFKTSCVYFSAASRGDIFLAFASVPGSRSSWFYVHLSGQGVGFYRGLQLQKSELGTGIGSLGETDLFDSYFLCLSVDTAGGINMQYGKGSLTDASNTVSATHTFTVDHGIPLPTFFAFGAGSQEVSVSNVQIRTTLPKLKCSPHLKNHVISDGKCLPRCHSTCNQCRKINDPSACLSCRKAGVLETAHALPGGRLVCYDSCPKGYAKLNSQQILCSPCPVGTYKNLKGDTSCLPCKVGYFSDTRGSEKCEPCPNPEFCQSPGCSTCSACQAGEYAETPGSDICRKCQPGSASNIAGITRACPKCQPGQFAADYAQTHCKLCENGYYSNTTNATKCNKCEPGYGSVEGSSSCHNNCPAGKYLDLDRKCQKCKHGHYSGVSGSYECKKCSPGTFQKNAGSKSCLKCPVGQYLSSYAGITCTFCLSGHYQPKIGQSICLKCPVGHAQQNRGKTKCIPCRPGYYQAYSGQSHCLKCTGTVVTRSQNGRTVFVELIPSNRRTASAANDCVMNKPKPVTLASDVDGKIGHFTLVCRDAQGKKIKEIYETGVDKKKFPLNLCKI